MQSIFETLRNVLHEANIDKRVQYMVEVMFAIRKDGFKQHPSVVEELDKCEEEDQFTHALQLDDDLKGEEGLNVFKAGMCELGSRFWRIIVLLPFSLLLLYLSPTYHRLQILTIWPTRKNTSR